MESCNVYWFSTEHHRGCRINYSLMKHPSTPQVGLPAKSGVSGAVLLVVPNVMGVMCWSPPLDRVGNSVRGIHFCQVSTGITWIALAFDGVDNQMVINLIYNGIDNQISW